MLGLYLKGLISVVKVKWKRRFFILRGSLINGRVSFGILWHNLKKKTCAKNVYRKDVCKSEEKSMFKNMREYIRQVFSMSEFLSINWFCKFWCYKNNRIIRYRIIVNLSWENLAKIFLVWCLFYKAVQLFLLRFSRILLDLSHY